MLLLECPKLFRHHREESPNFFSAKPEILIRADLPVEKPVKNLIYRFLEIGQIDFFKILVKDAPRQEEFFSKGHIS